ncbi:MAG: hypothetical protein ABI600_16965, partial [Luteolibacter sp.]
MLRSIVILGLAAATPAHAQDPAPRIVKCRLVAFEKPAESPPELFAAASSKGEFTRNTISLSIDAALVDYVVPASGKLAFRAAAAENSPVVATATIPEKADRVYLFLMPAAPGGTQLFRIIPVEESDKTTPEGGAFVCNISSHNSRVTMGEFKYELLPGKSVSVPQPTRLDEYNMAPLNIQLDGAEGWTAVKDSMTRFSKRERYFMFTYVEPKLGRPMVKIYQQVVPINTTRENPPAAKP